MKTVSLHAAKAQLSRLVDEAAAGAEIVIVKAGRPMVRLVPLTIRRPRRGFGRDRGSIAVRDDFDAPLDHDLGRSFGAALLDARR